MFCLHESRDANGCSSSRRCHCQTTAPDRPVPANSDSFFLTILFPSDLALAFSCRLVLVLLLLVLFLSFSRGGGGPNKKQLHHSCNPFGAFHLDSVWFEFKSDERSKRQHVSVGGSGDDGHGESKEGGGAEAAGQCHDPLIFGGPPPVCGSEVLVGMKSPTDFKDKHEAGYK